MYQFLLFYLLFLYVQILNSAEYLYSLARVSIFPGARVNKDEAHESAAPFVIRNNRNRGDVSGREAESSIEVLRRRRRRGTADTRVPR